MASNPQLPETSTEVEQTPPCWVRRYPSRVSPEVMLEKKAKFLEILSKWGNVNWACKEISIRQDMIHQWMILDPEFGKDVAEAKNEAVANLEKAAWKRATIGVKSPVFHRGTIVGHVRKPSDQLAMFLLKAERPDKYKDSQELTGPNGGPILAQIAAVQVHLVRPEDVQPVTVPAVVVESQE